MDMKTDQIKSIIESMFDTNSHITSILIDGQWGVGKTYATLDALEKQNHADTLILLSSVKLR